MYHLKLIGNTLRSESRSLSLKTISVKTLHTSHIHAVQCRRYRDSQHRATGKQRKHGHDPNLKPYRITQVCDNGAVQLVKVADDNSGAVYETWNIRNVNPRRT